MKKTEFRFEFVLSNTKKRKELLNQNDRLHWKRSHAIVKNLQILAMAEVRKLKINKPIFSKENKCKVYLIVCPPTKRRVDPDNFSPTLKALVDGFTRANFWTDDNYQIITQTAYRHGGLSGIDGKYKLIVEVKDD